MRSDSEGDRVGEVEHTSRSFFFASNSVDFFSASSLKASNSETFLLKSSEELPVASPSVE